MELRLGLLFAPHRVVMEPPCPLRGKVSAGTEADREIQPTSHFVHHSTLTVNDSQTPLQLTMGFCVVLVTPQAW